MRCNTTDDRRFAVAWPGRPNGAHFAASVGDNGVLSFLLAAMFRHEHHRRHNHDQVCRRLGLRRW